MASRIQGITVEIGGDTTKLQTALKCLNGDISQEQYDALQREIIETEQDLKKLEAQANQSATALQKTGTAGEKLKTVGDNMQ